MLNGCVFWSWLVEGVGFGFGLDTVDASIIRVYAWPGLALGVDARATSLWVYAFPLYAISDTEGNGSAMLPGSTSPKARCIATGWRVDILGCSTIWGLGWISWRSGRLEVGQSCDLALGLDGCTARWLYSSLLDVNADVTVQPCT